MTLVLENEVCRAEILPSIGARVQQVKDRRAGRGLLFAVAAADPASDDFLTATTGGWDLMFPNDDPWRGHPDHGRAWNVPYTVRASAPASAELTLDVALPPVTITRGYELLPPPRCGLREEIRIAATGDTGPFLVAPHPMLAVEAGWRVRLPEGARDIAADAVLPGRFEAGQALGDAEWARAATVPPGDEELVEVLYVAGITSGVVADPVTGHEVAVRWGATLPHLWICTLCRHLGPKPVLLLEPCTARPYRLDESIAAERAVSLTEGEAWTGWVEVESIPANAPKGAANRRGRTGPAPT